MYVCSCDEQFTKIERQIKLIDNFLRTYKWLSDAYVLDFFTESHWNSLPETWIHVLNEFSTEDIANFISTDENFFATKNVLPLSLQAFRKSCLSLSYKRKPFNYERIIDILSEISQKTSIKIDFLNAPLIWNENASEEFQFKGGQHFHINSIFSKHVKPKKLHEIYRLSKMTEDVMKLTNCTRVVDIGAGQGHLSRYLSLVSGFKVLTIEGEGCHVAGAQKIDREVVKNLTKKNQTNSMTPPSHKVHFLSAKSDSNDFRQILEDSYGKCDKTIPFSMLGLHTCGNLAPTILKTFVETETAKNLISVGCCYMKTDTYGFPMSNCVKQLPICENLSYEAKEVACHAIEIFQERLKCNPELLSVHCYRATLEEIIVRRHPHLKRAGLRSIKHVQNLTFKEYAQKALSKQSIVIPTEDFDSPIIESRLGDWKKVVVFYCLRLLLAPVIETLILLDRMAYLYQSGISSCILPIFDPKLSPRNLVLIAIKPRVDN